MSGTASVFLEAGDFAVGQCSVCRRDVLTYSDGEGSRERRCIHCDQRLGGELRWVDVADLERLGYTLDSDGRGGGCVSCTAGGCATQASPSRERRGDR
ncbi:MAG: hypothetical protein ACREQQ_01400 [Candidatus Binatia bacterium]